MNNAGKNALMVVALLLLAGAGIAGGAVLNGALKANKVRTPVDEEVSQKTSDSVETSSSSSSTSVQHAPIIGVTGEGGRNGNLYRTGAALGKTFEVDSVTGTITSDFDDVFPYCDIREVSDAAGNVFVEIPKHYTRYTYNSSNYTFTTEICEEQLEGFILNPIFTDGNGHELESVKIGKYAATGTAAKATSKSGQAHLTSVTHEGMRDACAANGEGYQMLDIWANKMLQDLFKIEFATTNSQTIMEGNVNGSKQNSGKCDSIGENKSGWDLTTGCMTYRGIENLWGNIWQWLDGMTFSSRDVYVCYDPAEYGSGKTDSPYVKIGYKTNTAGDGNSNRHGFDPNNPFAQISAECNGTDCENGGYWFDYAYTANACPGVGGRYGNGSGAGLWALDSNTLTYSYDNVGGRLLLR